jgi:tetratricopeptide (TPR) repeat protein
MLVLCQLPAIAQNPLENTDPSENIRVNASNNAIQHNRRGMEYLSQGYPLHAINEFKLAIMLNPNATMSASLYNNLGQAYEVVKEYDLAIMSYQHAIKINPEFALYYKNLVQAYHNKKALRDAIKHYEQIVKENPQDAQAYFILGLVYKKLNNNEKSISAFNTFINLEPRLDLAHTAKKYIHQMETSKP